MAMRLWLRGLTILALGAVVGPVLFAVVASAVPQRQVYREESVNDVLHREIGDMMATYHTEKNVRMRGAFIDQVPPHDGEECGYEPDRIFPGKIQAFVNSRKAKSYNDYAGYFWLNHWHNEVTKKAIDSAIADRLVKRIDRFEAGFLRRCMQSTLLSDVCYDKVERLRDEAYDGLDRKLAEKESDFMLFGHETNVICSFFDGVAARRGIPLSKRPTD